MFAIVTSERLMNESGGRLSIWNTEHAYQGHLPGHPWPALRLVKRACLLQIQGPEPSWEPKDFRVVYRCAT